MDQSFGSGLWYEFEESKKETSLERPIGSLFHAGYFTQLQVGEKFVVGDDWWFGLSFIWTAYRAPIFEGRQVPQAEVV